MTNQEPYTLECIEEELQRLYNRVEEKWDKTFVIKYKGKILTLDSGKWKWKTAAHAKNALHAHFNWYKNKYSIPPTDTYVDPYGVERQNYDYSNIEARTKEFREKLIDTVEIVETDK